MIQPAGLNRFLIELFVRGLEASRLLTDGEGAGLGLGWQWQWHRRTTVDAEAARNQREHVLETFMVVDGVGWIKSTVGG